MHGEARQGSLTVQITAQHFVAGVVLENGVVVEAAPIVKYMVGWTRARMHSYCTGKRWRINWQVDEAG